MKEYEKIIRRMEALSKGEEVPFVYKTEAEQQVDAIVMFLTNYKARIVVYIIVILIMLFLKFMIGVPDTKGTLKQTKNYIAQYGSTIELYDLKDTINDEDWRTIKIYGKTLGEAKERLEELVEDDKKQRIIPNIVIIIGIFLIVNEIEKAKKNDLE